MYVTTRHVMRPHFQAGFSNHGRLQTVPQQPSYLVTEGGQALQGDCQLTQPLLQ
jgi:hypothetical protein